MAEETKNTEEPKTESKDKAPKDLMGMLEYYLVKKAPFQIPDNAKEWIVKYGPWITVVLLVIALPSLLLALGVTSALLPLAGVYAPGFGVATIVSLAQLALEAAALPGLFARKMSGWNLLFYAVVLGAVGGLVSTFYGSFGSLFSAVIGAVVGLYVLFQIRPLYKK